MSLIQKGIFIFIALTTGLVNAGIYPEIDVRKLADNKGLALEALDENGALALKRRYSFAEAQSFQVVLQNALRLFNSGQKPCDLGLAYLFQNELEATFGIIESHEALKALRAYKLIDDMFYEILSAGTKLINEMDQSLQIKPKKPLTFFTAKAVAMNDVPEIYRQFETWPDENQVCSLGAYSGLVNSVYSKGKKNKKGLMKALHWKAYESGVISASTYKKLLILTEREALSWPIYLKGYLDKVLYAKDSLGEASYGGNEEDGELDPDFVKNLKKRLGSTSWRRRLYEKYNSNQIIILADVLVRASRRMGVDPNVITSTPAVVTNYVLLEDGEEKSITERYTFSPGEQFSFAVKLLRKELFELSSMKTFRNVSIRFEDVVFAALETGYIERYDMEYALSYDDLWNPEIGPWEKYKSYLRSLTGTATMFLPAPWNVVGAVGIVFINAKMDSENYDHSRHTSIYNIFD